MAKNWMAGEATEVLLKGENKVEIAEIGSRFPLFTVAVMRDGTESLLDILKALPKVTARVVENGLKDLEEGETETEKEQEQEEEAEQDKTEADTESDLTDEDDYDSMTSAQLYKLCCERGISSKCKNRKKATLIALLEENDNKGETKETKQEEEETKEEAEDEWEDEDDEKESDPYANKTAKELYKMCKDRGIKAHPKKKASVYAELLKKDDEKAKESDADVEDEDDDDDEWEI